MDTEHLPPGSIVVGVDAAQPTVWALEWAADLAALEHRHVVLVHGTGSPLGVALPSMTQGSPDPLDLFADLQAAAHGLLARATTRVVSRQPGLVVHQVVRSSDARQAVLDASADAAMIVMGSRGRGHVLSIALGSVSEEVVGRATCPVVVIRPRHEHIEPQGVLVGTDEGPVSLPALHFAYEQAALRGLPLTVMHTVWDEVAARRPSRVTSADDPDLAEVRRTLVDSLAGPTARFPGVPTRLLIGYGVPAECLLTLADSMDLVVVGHHERGLLGRLTHGSTATAILERASVPIAVVPVSDPGPRSSPDRA
ncbi:universal stress protein [Nocardioides cynanchi]|uniref:universal stress protein n=1 Tax=Nocardioides cynanchi TaxID=2558918 RepID=UPI001246E16C|nr:universal stress protein [Nocardioides cynanchi]